MKLLYKYNILLMVLLSFTFATKGSAVENRHQVSLGYGIGSSYDLANLVDFEIDGLPEEYEMVRHTRTINAEYLYRRDERVSFGGIVSFSNQTFDHNMCQLDEDGHRFYENYYKAAETTHSRFVLMPKLHLRWFERQHVCMYSKFAIGADIKYIHEKAVAGGYVPESKVKGNLAGQVSPICVSAGSDHIRFFTELGIGCQSVLEFGFSYRFGK